MWLIVGLGNPGASYAGTRHNVGFAVIDALAERWGIKAWQGKFGGKAAVVDAAGRTVLLLKPWTYMNRSGDSVAVAMGFYKLPLDRLMVVLDDMALEPGRIRLRARGSAGGHHGLEDILLKLGTDQVARCRVGIGASRGRDGAGYVLSRPAAEEQTLLGSAVERSRDAILCWLECGMDRAMTDFNRGPADADKDVPNE
jgi:peptidyl-tRNA hydrolase, PTH1 family